jgi:hypothetical protein
MSEISEDAILSVSFNGADGQTEGVLDESPSDHGELTAFGNVALSDSQYKFEPTSSSFDGTNSKWGLPDSPDWDLWLTANQNISMSFWYRFNTVTASHGFIQQYQDSNNNWRFYYEFSVGKLWVTAQRPFQNPSWGANWTAAADTWYHILFSLDVNQDAYFFVDGVQQTTTSTSKKDWTGGVTAQLQIGRNDRNGHWADGFMDDIYIETVATTSNFTPPTEPHGGPFTPPPPPSVEATGPALFRDPVVPRRKKPKTNPGFSVTPGMNVPVPIKMDKWSHIYNVPARQKKKGRGRTENVYVDFSVPPPEAITLDKWFFQHPIPKKRFEKKIVRPSEFMFNFVEVWQVKNGNYQDTGVYGFTITKTSDEAATFKDVDAFDLTITATHVEDFQLEDVESISFTIKYPDTGNEVFNSGVPGFVSANVIIDGVNESDNIQGVIAVTREDNTAARFKCILEFDQSLSPPRKASALINKVVNISFAAADMTGVVADYVPIFVGLCKHVTFNDDQRSIVMTGYDYGGAHQTRGEFVSNNVTDVLTGTLYIGSAGTHSLGHSPIWGVVWGGNSEVKDGEDYFVNTLNGTIIVPISSRILQFPGSLSYNYQNPFSSMKEIIQSVATLKGWTLQEDNVTIEDYSSASEHPVLSLSDESIIDVCRKFLELSGAKVESNLFPNLRVYSEVQNVINTVNTHTIDESEIFENTLTFRIDYDNILNEQTTRSVQKINANVVVGAEEVIAEFEAEKPTQNPFTFQPAAGGSVWNLNLGIEAVLAEHRIRKQGLNSISFTSSGRFFAFGINDSFIEPITGASWNLFTDGDDFVIQLKHRVVVLGRLNVRLYTYPAIEYTLTVNGSKINYGAGTIEDVKIVTAQRPIGGVSETLKGDVYENPYIETAQHCANICDAILLEHGNPYSTRFEIPVFVGKDLNIGDFLNIERDSAIRFSGLIKTLSYSINLQNGENSIFVTAKGVGFGI